MKNKGKILRVKHGYNPNSSSMGSVVFALPVPLLAVSVAFTAVAGAISSFYIEKSSKSEDNNHQEKGKEEEHVS